MGNLEELQRELHDALPVGDPQRLRVQELLDQFAGSLLDTIRELRAMDPGALSMEETRGMIHRFAQIGDSLRRLEQGVEALKPDEELTDTSESLEEVGRRLLSGRSVTTFDVRGVKLAADVLTTDTGRPPVVFLHGLDEDRSVWRKAIAAVHEEGFPAIALDLRGVGDSTVLGEAGELVSLELPELARDVDQLVRDLGSRYAHWVGTGTGGLVIQEAAKLGFGSIDPSKARIVLTDSFTGLHSVEAVREVAEEGLQRSSLLRSALSLVPERLGREVDPEVLQEAIFAMGRRDPGAYKASIDAFAGEDFEGLALDGHVLVVGSGTMDELDPESARLKRQSPYAQLCAIEHGRGCSHLTQPDLFHQALVGFLNE